MDRLHLLTDNHDISDDEYTRARSLLDELRTLHLTSRQYLEHHGQAPDTFLPGNIWGEIIKPGDFPNWTYGLVNYAKCVSPFTGFDSMMWGRRDTPGQVDVAKANDFYNRFLSGAVGYQDVAQQLEREFSLSERMRQSLPQMTDSYDQLVSGIPEHYRIVAPPRAGELGALHHDRIINPDLISYQRRVNALYAGGALQPIEDAIAVHGSANYLEIGPGHCFFAYALAECFAGKLDVFLIDLPYVMANGCAYLTCAAGTDRIGLVTTHTTAAINKPFVLVPNYLVPDYEHHLPDFDLVHNATSFNEMNAQQVAYYFDLVARHMADDGTFHITGGDKQLDYHVDAMAAARVRFPNNTHHAGAYIEDHLVVDGPNTFIRYPFDAPHS